MLEIGALDCISEVEIGTITWSCVGLRTESKGEVSFVKEKVIFELGNDCASLYWLASDDCESTTCSSEANGGLSIYCCIPEDSKWTCWPFEDIEFTNGFWDKTLVADELLNGIGTGTIVCLIEPVCIVDYWFCNLCWNFENGKSFS